MGCCLAAKFHDQREVVEISCYQEVVIGIVPENVDANFLPWITVNIMWDEGLLLLVGSMGIRGME